MKESEKESSSDHHWLRLKQSNAQLFAVSLPSLKVKFSVPSNEKSAQLNKLGQDFQRVVKIRGNTEFDCHLIRSFLTQHEIAQECYGPYTNVGKELLLKELSRAFKNTARDATVIYISGGGIFGSQAQLKLNYVSDNAEAQQQQQQQQQDGITLEEITLLFEQTAAKQQQLLAIILDSNFAGLWVERAQVLRRSYLTVQASSTGQQKSFEDDGASGSLFTNNLLKTWLHDNAVTLSHHYDQTPCHYSIPSRKVVHKLTGLTLFYDSLLPMLFQKDKQSYVQVGDYTEAYIQQSTAITDQNNQKSNKKLSQNFKEYLEASENLSYGRREWSNGAFYEGELAHAQYDGNGVYVYENGDRYEGHFSEGFLQGFGVLYYRNLDRYEGNWVQDVQEGKGVFYFANGNLYEGDFESNSFHGRGRHTFSSGDSYQGEFKHGKMEGNGKFTYANGNFYQGEFVNNKKHGHGTMHFTSGAVNRGQFFEDEFQGQTRYKMDSGQEIEGHLVDGVLEGEARVFSADGHVMFQGAIVAGTPNGACVQNYSDGTRQYVGKIKNGVFEDAHGEYVFEDGSVYRGRLQNGQFEGEGEFVQAMPGGKSEPPIVYKGQFVQGQFQGNGQLTWGRGSKYEGLFQGGLYNGRGRLVFSKHEYYEGDFENGLFSGSGIYTYATGERYEGNYVAGKMQGNGKFTWQDGDYYEGLFQDDHFDRGIKTTARGLKFEQFYDQNGTLLLEKKKIN